MSGSKQSEWAVKMQSAEDEAEGSKADAMRDGADRSEHVRRLHSAIISNL